MKYIMLFLLLLIVGCSDPYEACVSKKQDEYRKKNPNASYAKSSTENEKFRKECR